MIFQNYLLEMEMENSLWFAINKIWISGILRIMPIEIFNSRVDKRLNTWILIENCTVED